MDATIMTEPVSSSVESDMIFVREFRFSIHRGGQYLFVSFITDHTHGVADYC